MTRPIRTFCLGLNRTGTGTLRAAFEKLGYNVSRHSAADIRAFRDGDTDALLDRAEAFDFLSDLPWPLIWRELHDRFGDSARYVLTTRSSAQVWVESQKRHTESIHPGTISTRVAYGYKYPHGVEEHFAAFYERHNAEVRAYFAGRPEIFAEYCVDAAPGWGPICALLGREARCAVPAQECQHQAARIGRGPRGQPDADRGSADTVGKTTSPGGPDGLRRPRSGQKKGRPKGRPKSNREVRSAMRPRQPI